MTRLGPTTGNDRPFFGVELKLERARMHAQAFGASVAEWQSNTLSAHGRYQKTGAHTNSFWMTSPLCHPSNYGEC